jgi:hypothetical protein
LTRPARRAEQPPQFIGDFETLAERWPPSPPPTPGCRADPLLRIYRVDDEYPSMWRRSCGRAKMGPGDPPRWMPGVRCGELA